MARIAVSERKRENQSISNATVACCALRAATLSAAVSRTRAETYCRM
jgi:hypothetical protein